MDEKNMQNCIVKKSILEYEIEKVKSILIQEEIKLENKENSLEKEQKSHKKYKKISLTFPIGTLIAPITMGMYDIKGIIFLFLIGTSATIMYNHLLYNSEQEMKKEIAKQKQEIKNLEVTLQEKNMILKNVLNKLNSMTEEEKTKLNQKQKCEQLMRIYYDFSIKLKTFLESQEKLGITEDKKAEILNQTKNILLSEKSKKQENAFKKQLELAYRLGANESLLEYEKEEIENGKIILGLRKETAE